jgi:tetratricopeptide (TPR) repeat protein
MREGSCTIISFLLLAWSLSCFHLFPPASAFSWYLPPKPQRRQCLRTSCRVNDLSAQGKAARILYPSLFSNPTRQSSSSLLADTTTHESERRPPQSKNEGRRDPNLRTRNAPPKNNQSLKQIVKSMFRVAKGMERQGRWREASTMFEKILLKDHKDAYTHLALARLEARRERNDQLRNNSTTISLNKAQRAFLEGTTACPTSVHLWQAWAIYEESCGNTDRARELFQQALNLDKYNPYACHAFGLMEKRMGNTTHARDLFTQALVSQSTAALVCSMGELMIANKEFKASRDLYARHLLRLETDKDRTEVYLASSWLEERYFANYGRAEELIQLALIHSPGSSMAQVALARLEGRNQKRNSKNGWSEKDATVRRLANACISIEKGTNTAANPVDGRLFNAWANIEVKSRRFEAARKILKKGTEMYPNDHSVSCQLPLFGEMRDCINCANSMPSLRCFVFFRDLFTGSYFKLPAGSKNVSATILERDIFMGRVYELNHPRLLWSPMLSLSCGTQLRISQ